ncbi:ArsC/Spx/MgsR family protein [Aquisalinus flavus]|uniref:Arsenate reductase n=1 Tax=Aquisalinus flavus TaxID=1526572 RepID=A0A8J2V406_9PROT|nr:ArsC/Spx/MgsR family protein [Aquisalinus flavus]MBD0427121.1 ArsC family transcriptional regulator [Aquisalinus flavus]UNE46942.1 ArsC family transcriptional regulator [Aquisalinus flavus]GGC98553.1 arsenate reductase [Aquisalinus flavus]
MKVYGLKNCDTCRKAMKDLAASGRELEIIDMRGGAVSKARITRWLKAVGAEALVNRRSTTWRGLTEEQKQQAMGNGAKGDAASLLAEHPTLIKRPVVETGDEVFVGWTPTSKQALL